MSRLPSRPQFVPGEGRHPALTLVGVVRLLQLGHAHPSLVQRVSLLMDHMEDIQVTKGTVARDFRATVFVLFRFGLHQRTRKETRYFL